MCWLFAVVVRVYWSSLHLSNVLILKNSGAFFVSSFISKWNLLQSLMIMNWQAQSIGWTDEKHNLYLDLLERSFVDQLNHSKRMRGALLEEDLEGWHPSLQQPMENCASSDEVRHSWEVALILIYSTAANYFLTFPLIVTVQGFAKWLLAED